MKLICVTYAGGTVKAFDEIAELLAGKVNVIALEYPGRGKRIKDPFYKSFQEMVEDIAEHANIAIAGEEPYAIWGYSMGSVVVYEMLAQGLLKKEPTHVFLSSHEAPTKIWDSMSYARMDDLEFAHYIADFGGFSKFEDSMLNNKFFMKMVFNPIREDYKLIADYKWKGWDKLSYSVTFLYSDKDVPTADVMKWQELFEKTIDFIEIGDNHFFIRDNGEKLADIILNRIYNRKTN